MVTSAETMAAASDDRPPTDAARRGRTHIIGIGAIAALLVVVLLTLFAQRDRAAEHAQAEKLVDSTALLLAEHAGRLVEAGEFLLERARSLAGDVDAPIPNDVATHLELRRLTDAASFVEALFIADGGGWNRVTSREWPVRSLNIADREYFRRFRDGAGGTLVDRLETNPFTGKPLIVMARRLDAPPDAFRGIVGAAITPEYFRSFYERVAAGYDLTIALLRSDRLMLVRFPDSAAGGGEATRFPAIFVPEGDRAVAWGHSSVDGVLRLFAMRRLPGSDLWVAVGMDAAAIRGRWMDRVWIYAVYAAVALAGIAALTLMALARARREALAWDRLRDANRTLEARVAERTAALTLANAQLSAALKDKEVLFREVHHRVKNNLQVVSSLLRMQADRLPLDARSGHMQSLARIQSMSLVHEMLYRTNQPSRIDLAEYLGQLAGTMVDALADEPGRIRTEVRAAPLVTDLDTAIPLGLLVCELVGNALKHAFPDGRGGAVRIGLDHAHEIANLTVADDGIGLDGASRPEGGLGMMLVGALAAQIGGTLTMTPGRDGGTVASLVFPWSGVDRGAAAA